MSYNSCCLLKLEMRWVENFAFSPFSFLQQDTGAEGPPYIDELHLHKIGKNYYWNLLLQMDGERGFLKKKAVLWFSLLISLQHSRDDIDLWFSIWLPKKSDIRKPMSISTLEQSTKLKILRPEGSQLWLSKYCRNEICAQRNLEI